KQLGVDIATIPHEPVGFVDGKQTVRSGRFSGLGSAAVGVAASAANTYLDIKAIEAARTNSDSVLKPYGRALLEKAETENYTHEFIKLGRDPHMSQDEWDNLPWWSRFFRRWSASMNSLYDSGAWGSY